VGRNKKETNDFFKHTINCEVNEMVDIVKSQFGFQGYALVYILFEKIAENNGKIDIGNVIKKMTLLKEIDIKEKKFDKIIKLCLELNIFDKENYINNYITSKYLSESLEQQNKRRIKNDYDKSIDIVYTDSLFSDSDNGANIPIRTPNNTPDNKNKTLFSEEKKEQNSKRDTRNPDDRSNVAIRKDTDAGMHNDNTVEEKKTTENEIIDPIHIFNIDDLTTLEYIQIKESQYNNLINSYNFTQKEIYDVAVSFENYPKRKNYKNHYLTILTWLKMRFPDYAKREKKVGYIAENKLVELLKKDLADKNWCLAESRMLDLIEGYKKYGMTEKLEQFLEALPRIQKQKEDWITKNADAIETAKKEMEGFEDVDFEMNIIKKEGK